jgi:hypothetical protein
LGFDITQLDGEVKEEIKRCLEVAGVEYTEPSDKVVQVNDVGLARRMWSLCGIGSDKMRLPPGWESATESWMREVLAGLLDGDGTIPKGTSLSAVLYTTSWSLASQVMHIVRTLGGNATAYATTNKEGTRHQCYSVAIKLGQRLPSVKSFKIEDPDKIETAYPEVVQVKEVMYDDWTYDLATESRSFTANGIRTHNSFHTGGVVGAKGTSATSVFNRLEQLLAVPKILPGSATLADTDGVVKAIEKDPAGGWRVYVGDVSHYVPASRAMSVKKGDEVKKGEAITDGPKNPRDMLARTNMNEVQQYLTNEIHDIYKTEGPVRRRNVETFVRTMTNLCEIKDSGSHDSLMRGDHIATSEVVAFNRALKPGQKEVIYKPILQRVEALPLELQTDWLARLQSTNLKKTILDASAEGWRSLLHGTHPIPGMAYGKSFGEGTEKEPWLY